MKHAISSAASDGERHIDDVIDRDDHCSGVRLVSTKLVPQWADVSQEDIAVTELMGGITNKLYKCEFDGLSVLVRHYGSCTEKIIDRTRETKVFKLLHHAGHGTRYYGSFGNGCVYGYVAGEALSPSDLSNRECIRFIACYLARFHRECTPLGESFGLGPVGEESRMWNVMEDWINQLPPTLSHVKNKEHIATYEALGIDLRVEIAAMRSTLEGVGEPLVLCHNDLLAGNVVAERVGGEVKRVSFIDFEYCDYNYRAFDVGNHFNEHMGFDVDVSLFPSRDTMHWFAECYLSVYAPDSPSPSGQIDRFVDNIVACASASHLFWTIWALVQSYVSSIDFDYFAYAISRLQAYLWMKKMDE